MNLQDQFLSKLKKSNTQIIHDGEKEFKLTMGQIDGKPYIVFHDHPDMKSFGVFEPISIARVKTLAHL